MHLLDLYCVQQMQMFTIVLASCEPKLAGLWLDCRRKIFLSKLASCEPKFAQEDREEAFLNQKILSSTISRAIAHSMAMNVKN